MTDVSAMVAKRNRRTLAQRIARNWELYLLLLLPTAYIVIFHYGPMYGVQIAFKEYIVTRGITGSPWIGFDHFQRFLGHYMFWRIFRNTIVLSLYQLAAGFPVPIILAILLNYCPNKRYKKTVQMITYAPHFISVVVMVGIIFQMLGPRYGLVNSLFRLAGGTTVDFMGRAELFRHIYVWSGVWQRMGWSSIIYLAALSAIDPQLHEAAIVDGATKVRRIWHVDLPGILPTIVILLILNVGRLMRVGFEKALLMQNPLNISHSEIIQTYVYKIGIAGSFPQFSYASAIGLFNAIISFILLISVNGFAKRLGQASLW
jgi:ABC-type polysaccharide transport system permease subunit